MLQIFIVRCFVNFEQNYGVATTAIAPQVHLGDIDTATGRSGANRTHYARLIGVGNIKHVLTQLGLQLYALYVDHPGSILDQRAANMA